ncbi:MAG TPA: GH1 family beta-glucosidase [Kiritimatiellia bacterium]|jgi:beta-glucosidase
MNRFVFPEDFVWGTATSSYQIEGGVNLEGRGESIWDRFSHTPGKIKDGSNGDIACDHFHKWKEDIAMMRQLGHKGYRLSIAWPRILPTGRGTVNQAGLDFYSRIIDELLRNEIEPFVTLYHWDLPQTLQDEGGWVARSTAEAFIGYTDIVTKHLGDRVKRWITHNEPWCVSILGHLYGDHAPGLKDWKAALPAAHHVLLSHGWAIPVIRANSRDCEAGITLLFSPYEPASESAADYKTCRECDGFFNRWFVDPVYGRGYPADKVEEYIAKGYLPKEGLTFVKEGDMEDIGVDTDFLGVNFYTRDVVRNSDVPEEQNLPKSVERAPREEWTEMGWEVFPEGLYRVLVRMYYEYLPRKVYVTENGCSYSDGPGPDGKIRDTRRIQYLQDHFIAAHRAVQSGVPVAGYFVWALMDNFEWGLGIAQRFGLVHVDYKTLKRTPKDSAHWYKKVIEQNGVTLPDGQTAPSYRKSAPLY